MLIYGTWHLTLSLEADGQERNILSSMWKWSNSIVIICALYEGGERDNVISIFYRTVRLHLSVQRHA